MSMIRPSAINTLSFQSASDPLIAYISAIPSLIAYFPFDDTSGLVARSIPAGFEGTISGALVNQDAGGLLKKAYLFDGVNDYVNIFTAALQSAFAPNTFTAIQFIKMRQASVWSDGIQRRTLNLGVDANNFERLRKHTTNNQFLTSSGYGAVFKTNTIAISSTNFFMVGYAIHKVNDTAKTYLNGVQNGATENTIGIWAGSLASTLSVIGAGSTAGINPHDGYICHTAIFNAELDASTLLQIAQLGGVA